jgi:HEPN domain-containing protein
MAQQETLQAHIDDFLPRLDEELSKVGMPVSKRPMEAARFFVDHLVLGIEGDSKEGYLAKPWFAYIFRPVQDWYKNRYGEAQVHPERAMAGADKHHGALYLVRVPLTIAKPQGDGTCWVTFAKDVLPGEDPASWVVDGPSLTHMRPRQLASLQRNASATATWIRGIANHLLTADMKEATKTMANSVLRHLDKGASDMCVHGQEAASLSVWELHMACEKAMKAYLSQQGFSSPKTHDLRELNKLAPAMHDWSEVSAALTRFPSEQRVMQWRYHERPAPTGSDLWRFYGVALQICTVYTARMTRKHVFNNFSVQLRRPPWLGKD